MTNTTETQRWFRPPRPHGDVIEDRSVSFLELFYDLVFVVLIAQIAHTLARNVTWTGVREFVVVFGLVWIAWIHGTLYHDLHGGEDGRSRSYIFIRCGYSAEQPPAWGCRLLRSYSRSTRTVPARRLRTRWQLSLSAHSSLLRSAPCRGSLRWCCLRSCLPRGPRRLCVTPDSATPSPKACSYSREVGVGSGSRPHQPSWLRASSMPRQNVG
jgi:hypothetical protein